MMKGIGNHYDAEIEYLEVNENSNGVPFIDTPYIPEGNIDMECVFMVNGAKPSEYGNIVSTGLAYQYKQYRIQCNKNPLLNFAINVSGDKSQYVNCKIGEINKVETQLSDNNTFLVNGKKYEYRYITPPNTTTGLLNTAPLFLFEKREEYMVYSRIYSLKVIENGKVELDLIPVRVGSEGYMYNRVNGQLLGNSGSGSFILGPDIN